MTKAVITPNSPTCQRILRVLAERGPLSMHDIAPLACCALSTLQSGGYMRVLKSLDLIHVAAWRKNLGSGGDHTKLFAAGPGQDAPKPARMTNGEKCRHHRTLLREMYGNKLAFKMFRSVKYGGAHKIVIDGRTIYERKPKAKPECSI